MTTPPERKRAVERAEDFLYRLADSRMLKRIPSEVREEARSILRHYPGSFALSGWHGEHILGDDQPDANHRHPFTMEKAHDEEEGPEEEGIHEEAEKAQHHP